MFTKEHLIKNILFKLSCLESYVRLTNSIGIFDANIFSEDFFAELLSILYGSTFINKNLFEKNFTSIDLVNDNKKIAVQVTSENSSTKIKETIEKFLEKKHYEKYSTLKMLLLKSKKQYKTKFVTNELFLLQIIDIADLSNEIRKCNVDILEDISVCIDRNLNIDEITKNDFANQLVLCTEDIKCIIDVFCKYKEAIKVELDTRTNYSVYPGIHDKNKYNNISEEDFEQIVLPLSPSFSLLDDFLKNPRNSSYLDKYYDVAMDIKSKLIICKNKYSNFFEAITNIYNIVAKSEIIQNKKNIYILLFYMYCQCDIGKNINAQTS